MLKQLPTIVLSDLCLSVPLLFGINILVKISIIWKLFNNVLHVGYVVAGGIPVFVSGVNSSPPVSNGLPFRYIKLDFAIVQAHDILHKRVFHSCFSTCSRSHHLSLTMSSSTINAYQYSLFINTLFLWNSVPPAGNSAENKTTPFQLALHHFLCC